MRLSVAASSAWGRNKLLATVIGLALTFGLLVAMPPVPAEAATCPCTIFTSSQSPTVASDSESVPIELGVKFRADQDGFVSGIRFYKGSGNTGTHTGSLWSSAGNRLATVTFTGESGTGWQQADFASPVAVNANTTYIASYYAPNGHYAADEGYFANSGVANAPLTALRNGVDGGNGVYRYGSGGGFPNSTFNSTNYWVDLIFSSSGADTTKPTVTDRQPSSGATGVPVTTTVSATFSELVKASTISMTLAAGSTVAASTSYDAASRTVTLTPNANLATSTTYTVNLYGARDTADNQMDPVTWTFTTGATGNGCPCTIWPSSTVPATTAAADNSAVELGVKFRANRDGYITGIRFYKGSGNTGTHVGSLWTSGGDKLGSVTFTGESATGWQKATFSAPVPVTANSTYVASYYAPVGRYAVNQDYFASAATTNGPLTALRDGTDGGNGIYRYGTSGFPNSTYRSSNYWVDVVFDTSANDTTAPTVVAKVPAAGSSGVAVGTSVSATFSEAVVGSSVNIELRGPGNTLVTASTTYSSASQTETLTPDAPLANSTTYTATVSGARDSSNNTMSPVTWSFTTAAPAPPPPDQGPGGPIAIITSSNPYSKYLAEILRTEGLNEFKTVDVSTLSDSTLAAYDVVVLGNVSVTAAQASTLTTWVNGGGNLIAMKPDSDLSSLLGITSATGTVDNGYLKVDPTTAPGAGIVSGTIQYHGTADNYSLSGAQAIATLYSNATSATNRPAVTLRDVGSNGGQAAAFTFDLPQSIVLTRQGNPAWVGTERDGQSPIRSDDMFFGGS
jgi:methionine-rich copper-binding protein CopC